MSVLRTPGYRWILANLLSYPSEDQRRPPSARSGKKPHLPLFAPPERKLTVWSSLDPSLFDCLTTRSREYPDADTAGTQTNTGPRTGEDKLSTNPYHSLSLPLSLAKCESARGKVDCRNVRRGGKRLCGLPLVFTPPSLPNRNVSKVPFRSVPWITGDPWAIRTQAGIYFCICMVEKIKHPHSNSPITDTRRLCWSLRGPRSV